MSKLKVKLEKVGTGKTVMALLRPPIHILKPHNVILAQITPRLHLDHFQGDLAGILQPMLRT